MANYNSNYTGEEIDAAIGKANASQPKLAEGAFEDGDKTKLDNISVSKAVDLDEITSNILSLQKSSTVYGARYDQVNDTWQRGVVISGVFVPCEVDTFPIHEQIKRGLLTSAGEFTPLHPENSERFAVDEIVGGDLVTNGGFDTDSDWTKGTGWSIADGVATSDGTQQSISQDLTFQGSWYKITLDYNNTNSSGYLQIYTSDGSSSFLESGVNRISVLVNYVASKLFLTSKGGWEGTVDNVSVYEIKTPDLTGTDGQVMVQYPRHHALNYSSGNYRYSMISQEPFIFDGVSSYVPAAFQGENQYAYLGAFLGTALEDSLTAEVGSVVKDTSGYTINPYPNPFTNRTRAQFRDQQQTGFFQYPWAHYEMLWTLWLTEYATWDTHGTLPGYTEAAAWDYAYAKKAGRTLGLGNASGSVVVDYGGDDSELVGEELITSQDYVNWISANGTVLSGVDSIIGTFSATNIRFGIELSEPIATNKLLKISCDIRGNKNATAAIQLTGTSLTSGNTFYSSYDITTSWQSLKIEAFIGSSYSAQYFSIQALGYDVSGDWVEIDNISVKEIPLPEGEYIANSYRGIEHFFGNVWQFLDGINVDNRVGDCHVYANHDPDTFADDTAAGYIDTGHAPAFGDVDGYIREMAWLGEPLSFYPADITGGSSSTYVGDYQTNNSGSWDQIVYGGRADSNVKGGAFATSPTYTSNTSFGVRPAA